MTINEEEVRAEKAIQLKRQRVGQLGEVRKKSKLVHDLMTNNATVAEFDQSLEDYEEAFHKFVDAHDKYMLYEDSGEKRDSMAANYGNERDLKFQTDVKTNEWRMNKAGTRGTPSVASSLKSVSSSVKEKRRLIEEAKIRMHVLEERQRLERLLEEREAEFRRKELEIDEERRRGKAEIERKVELLAMETEMKQATVSLMIEEDTEGKVEMDAYFGQETTGRSLSLPNHISPAETSETKCQPPADATVTPAPATHTPVFSQGGTASPFSRLASAQITHTPPGFPTMMTPSGYTTMPQNQSVLTTLAKHNIDCHSVSVVPASLNERATTFSPRQAQWSTSVPNHHAPDPSLLGPQSFQQSQLHYRGPYPSLQQEQTEAWLTIADAIRLGPSLPKVELIKFSGDSTEYAEFVTNFRDNIESQVKDDSQRLTRLLAQCIGKAKKSIRSCVNLPLGQRYSVAWETFRENFGQPHMIADACMKKLKDIQLRKTDAPTLMDFARQLEDARRILTSMGPQYANRLGNEDVIVMLMRKLPEEGLKRKWTDKAGDIIKTEGQVKYSDSVGFVRKCANRLNNRFGQELRSSSGRDRSIRPDQPQQKVTTLAIRSNRPVVKDARSIECPRCSGPHGVWRCQAFKSESFADILKIMRRHKLCRRCLDVGHFANSCEKNFTCRKPGCVKDHHFLFHPPDGDSGRSRSWDGDSNPSGSASSREQARGPSRADAERTVAADGHNTANSSAVAISSSSVLVDAVRTSRPRVCFKVVPVTVSGQDSERKITTYAFLDSGSDTILCLKSFAEELGLTCTPTIATVKYEGREHGHEVQLNVEALSGGVRFHLDHVLTTESLPVTPKHFATNAELKKWPHLDGISLPEIEDNKVSLLIGSDRPDMIENALEVRKGKKGQSFAVKTPLGWTVHGPMGQSVANEACVNFVRSEQETMISAQLERMYNAEFGDPLNDVEQGMSVEDLKAEAIMDKSVHLVNGHYRLRLPFRQDPPKLPDSFPVAEKRPGNLKRKMEKDPKFHQQYSAVMDRYQAEGSSRVVPAEEVATLSPIWYLPHLAVWHPRKRNEPRIVFDCASKSGGTSLNEQLLQGPEHVDRSYHQIQVERSSCRSRHQEDVSPGLCSPRRLWRVVLSMVARWRFEGRTRDPPDVSSHLWSNLFAERCRLRPQKDGQG